MLKHLGILEEAGLVTGYRRSGERLYRLTPEPLAGLEQWIREINTLWDARLLRLKAFVESADADEQGTVE